MFIITLWIRKRREQRRLLEEKEKREAEKQIQREKRDYEHGRTLQLTLNELQRTMDPLILTGLQQSLLSLDPAAGRAPS